MVNIFDYKGKNVYFIGIGGSSMSGLAGLLHDEGFIVSGSDKTKSHKTDKLEEKGIKIHIGHKAEQVNGADIIIFSAAISKENPEREEAKRLGIPELERCELVGQLMENSNSAICISGTHGKTTTTSMLAQAFLVAGADPTIHIGGELDFIGGSTRRGKGDSFICEACEYREGFLKFKPTIAVITNIDVDHLDYYKDIEHIESAFVKFINLLPKDGYVIAWGDDPRARRVAKNSGHKYITYGLSSNCDLRPENLSYDNDGKASFDAYLKGENLGHFTMNVSAEVNMLNGLATIAVSYIKKLDLSKVSIALSNFVGAHRRFELTSITDGVKCYTDYGHNPPEMKNALSIASFQQHNELWSVFQPHTYSRTKSLFNQFLDIFNEADHVLITDICAAREVDPGDISSEMFIKPLRDRGVDAVYTPTFDDCEKYLRANWHKGDIMISHGCGDIDILNEQIAKHGDTK